MSTASEFGPSPAAIPSGTVTFAFTDIEGSTRRWDRDRAAMQAAVRRHDAIVRGAIAAQRGHVFKTIGDAFCAAFSRAEDAAAAMLDAQRALGSQDFAAVDGLRVRVAIHTGTADERDGDYFGPAVNRVARLLGIGHGGQVLVSGVTEHLLHDSLPPKTSLRDLGEHRLRDLARPEHVYQLLAPDLPAEFPPLRSLNTLANNLPPQVTSFVGRETEVTEITTLLERHRLVTLVGSGGVGKTRMALQVAANAVDGSGDGVWLVELAPIALGEYVPTTIAQAVGLTLGAEGDPVDSLVAALRSKKLLLVLDNCEHLIDTAARIVAALINACPRVTILASSRQGLGIVGEAEYRMPSLPVPPAVAPAPGAGLRADAVARFDAVALFVERAQAVQNHFALTDENAPIVADICRRLDGIALAIELAAARIKMLSPQQLCDRLNERFRVLTGGGRDRLPRQQTLRALIDWSHALLDEREQRLFRRLGMFANDFTLEAALAVAAGGEFDEFVVFDLMASLVEKSLVMAEPFGGSTRYHLLESTRIYANDKLIEADERDAIEGRHLRFFRDRFAALSSDYDQLRPGIQAAFAIELDDLRAALDGAHVRREVTEGAQLLVTLDPTCWLNGGLGREGIARCEAFLRALPRSEPMLLGEVGALLTRLLLNTGRFTQAREAGVAAIGHARPSGNSSTLARALGSYAFALLNCNEFLVAEEVLREAEAITGVPPLIRMRVLDARAQLSIATGDLDAAETFIKMASAERPLRYTQAILASRLSEIEFRRGHYEHAVHHLREAVSLARNADASANLSSFLVGLGAMLALSGALDAAIDPAIEAMMLAALREPGHVDVTSAIDLLAYVAAALGDAERAICLAEYAEASFACIGFIRDCVQQAVYDRLTAVLQERFTPEERARRTPNGAALAPEAAIALARTLATERTTIEA